MQPEKKKLEPGFEPIWLDEITTLFRSLPLPARALYLVYRTHYDPKTFLLPPHNETCRMTGLHSMTVRRARAFLIKSGLIEARGQALFLIPTGRIQRNPQGYRVSRWDTGGRATAYPSEGYGVAQTGLPDSPKTAHKYLERKDVPEPQSYTPVESVENLDAVALQRAKVNGILCQNCQYWAGQTPTHLCAARRYSLPDVPMISLQCPDWKPKEPADAVEPASPPGPKPDGGDPAQPA